MFNLKIITSFAAAHCLTHYHGDCENLHGHNWKVEVSVTAIELDNAGLGVDFKIIKSKTNEILNTLDHKYLNEIIPFDTISPSSENIAKFIFIELSKVLNNNNISINKVTVWESDNANASYYE